MYFKVSNQEYWNEHAEEYDALYTSRWCQLEDERVTAWLKRLDLPVKPTVLDIGCGTGLGLKLLCQAGIICHYFGLDISPKMIEKFDLEPSCALSVNLTVADVATYEWPVDRKLNLIMSTYGPLSFSE